MPSHAENGEPRCINFKEFRQFGEALAQLVAARSAVLDLFRQLRIDPNWPPALPLFSGERKE
jgi:hypothetical protein